MRASIATITVALGLASAGCNVFIPDWGTQGKACHSDADCNGITCDPFSLCANQVFFANEGNGGHVTLPNPCGENVEISLADDGEWAYLLVGCTKEPARSTAWQIGNIRDSNEKVVVLVSSRDAPWRSTDCEAIGPLMLLPNHNGLIAGCAVGGASHLRVYERSSNDWRVTMNPWRAIAARTLALSPEFNVGNQGDTSRHVAIVDNQKYLWVISFGNNVSVLNPEVNLAADTPAVTFRPTYENTLALGECTATASTRVRIGTIDNNYHNIQFEDLNSSLTCVNGLTFNPAGTWLFGLAKDTATPPSSRVFAWKFGENSAAPSAADCEGCKQAVVISDGTDNVAIAAKVSGNMTELVEFKLGENATPGDSMITHPISAAGPLNGDPRGLALAECGPEQARAPLLVLATSQEVHLWDLVRLRK